MAKRVKKMPLEQFEAVRRRDWVPVGLAGAAVPEWLQGIPLETIHCIAGSGTLYRRMSYSGGAAIMGGDLIGGIDVYRYAPDDPVELNKDWYAVLIDPDDDTMLLIDGPIRDDEHWIDELPQRLKGIEVLAVPKPGSHDG